MCVCACVCACVSACVGECQGNIQRGNPGIPPLKFDSYTTIYIIIYTYSGTSIIRTSIIRNVDYTNRQSSEMSIIRTSIIRNVDYTNRQCVA